MQIAPLDANLKDWTQAASWLIAVIGGLLDGRLLYLAENTASASR